MDIEELLNNILFIEEPEDDYGVFKIKDKLYIISSDETVYQIIEFDNKEFAGYNIGDKVYRFIDNDYQHIEELSSIKEVSISNDIEDSAEAITYYDDNKSLLTRFGKNGVLVNFLYERINDPESLKRILYFIKNRTPDLIIIDRRFNVLNRVISFKRKYQLVDDIYLKVRGIFGRKVLNINELLNNCLELGFDRDPSNEIKELFIDNSIPKKLARITSIYNQKKGN